MTKYTEKFYAVTISLILVIGITPAFADISEDGVITNEPSINFGNLNEVQEISLPSAVVNLATNGDFETGDLNGWTTFLTSNGVLNPTVVLFDTDGDTVATESAQFRVGEVVNPGDVIPEGGGIFQIITTSGGTITIAADIASETPDIFGNGGGGQFTLYFDNVVVDSHDFGNIAGSTIERATLGAVINGVSSGDHEVKIEIGRVFTTSSVVPFQYIDDVMVFGDSAVGGESLSIDSTALILAGAQSPSVWLSSLALVALGIGAYVFTRNPSNMKNIKVILRDYLDRF